MTIGEPVIQENQYSEKAAKKEVLKRLTAYTAWCLWNDVRVIDDIWKNLNEVWNEGEKEKIKEELEQLKSYEYSIGKLDIRDDKTPKQYREIHKKQLALSLTRMRSFVESSRELKSWYDELKRRHSEHNPVKSYFDMIYEPSTSIRERFKAFDTGLTYLLYQQGSQVLHGSTLQGLIGWQENSLTPNLNGSTDHPELLAANVRSRCGTIFQLLASFFREYKNDM